MQDEARKLLVDIRDALNDISTFTAGMSLLDYEKDDLRRAAVERKFEIIGEACNRLSYRDSETFEKIPQAPQIIGFRNRLIHGYDAVDDAIVWDVVQSKLPILEVEVLSLLGVKFQEVVHAKESWDTWVNEDPKHPTTSNA